MTESTAIKRILLAYDASDEADRAFGCARDLARRYDAALEILFVITRPAFAESVESTGRTFSNPISHQGGSRAGANLGVRREDRRRPDRHGSPTSIPDRARLRWLDGDQSLGVCCLSRADRALESSSRWLRSNT